MEQNKKPKKLKAYLMIFVVIFFAFSAVTKCSYIPHNFKTTYVDMNLPEDMPSGWRAVHFTAAIFNHLRVTVLMNYMLVYEALFLEKKQYVEPFEPAFFVIDPKTPPAEWDKRVFVHLDWDQDGFAEASSAPPRGTVLLLQQKLHSVVPIVVNKSEGVNGLKIFDSNSDGVLDEKDPEFYSLKLIVMFGANSPISFSEIYQNLNIVTMTAHPKKTGEPVSSVVMAVPTIERFRSYYTKKIPYFEGVEQLPKLREWGVLPPLAAVMAEDKDLRMLVKSFASCNIVDVFANNQGTNKKIEEILFKWGQVEDVDPEGRGPFIDGRKLAFLEKLTAHNFFQLKKWSNPRPYAAMDLNRSWDTLVEATKNTLLFQSCGRPLFAADARYDYPLGYVLVGSGVNQAAVAEIVRQAKKRPKAEADAIIYYMRQYVLNTPRSNLMIDKMFISTTR